VIYSGVHWPILLVLSFHVNEQLVSVACSGSPNVSTPRHHTSTLPAPPFLLPHADLQNGEAICSTQRRRGFAVDAAICNSGAEDHGCFSHAINGVGAMLVAMATCNGVSYQTNAPATLPNHTNGRTMWSRRAPTT
jgi:hypothetical protein